MPILKKVVYTQKSVYERTKESFEMDTIPTLAEPEAETLPKGPCPRLDRLAEVFSKSGFGNSGDEIWALDHFARRCGRCWRHLEILATNDAVDIDLDLLSSNAARSSRQPPVALVLGRLVALLRGTGTEAALPPTHRYLLDRVGSGTTFDFWWLLIEEARFLTHRSTHRRLERWHDLAGALAEHSGAFPKLEWELRPLIRAYAGDELRVAGKPDTARQFSDEALEHAHRCCPVIRATICEVRADLHRSLREPRQALTYLEQAEETLRDVEIPGRLAETRTRLAMTRLLLNQVDAALDAFHEALRLIPEGTDPRLRLDILLHVAAVTIRRGDSRTARRCLARAEPLFEPYASALMLVHRHWLWGLVQLASGEFLNAEQSLLKALEGFKDFEVPLARAQVLVSLSQLYLRTRKHTELRRAVTELAPALRQPEVLFHVADEVECLVCEAGKNGVELPDLRTCEGSVTEVVAGGACIMR